MYFYRNEANSTSANVGKTSPYNVRANQHVKNVDAVLSYSKLMQFKVHKTLSLQVVTEFSCT